MKISSFGRTASLGLLLTLGLSACEKQLDLAPTTQVDAATALDTADKLESAIVGAYAKLDNGALYGTNFSLLPELLAPEDYVLWQGTFTSYRDVFRRLMQSNNAEATRTWQVAYQTINFTNIILEALPVVTDADLKAQYEGEARFIRGALFFELVRLYGLPFQAGASNPGVPLTLTANKTAEQASQQLARATVGEVYAQAIADLRAAETLLPEENASGSGRVNKFTAKAMLARLYLQQSNYAQARTLANDVIENSAAFLTPSVTGPFRTRNSSESLFEIQQNDQYNAGAANDGLATFFAPSDFARGDVAVLAPFLAKYEPTDARFTLLFIEDQGGRAGRIRSTKWNNFGQNIPVIRLAEMYLIRAEANRELGTSIGATPLEDVNTIRERAQATPLTAVTVADILKERQLELAFEGARIHDLRRRQLSAGTLPWNSPRLVFPIPLHDTNLNKALVQNPGYN
ncbi:RagB/SusD family nutrient uptake outer membrane protein [Hymenobacter yonginensis]|uniref:RagB/SusD family nutrient uptake outer membrane protein n=1 Tax=Hymenobacter yonginensis TaxID=748197 RepID=A0ABY7PKH3_9BACT|nr:RagB/SusD family nutrient uptake outer membrane protein [Hymenobacter yonginensis]WBO83122.1 RagB/SusD family nutrient uptake outer membrane protein [Hymenobacter yonginensis]